jgi:hypothetical protein
VGFAARLNITAIADALAALHQLAAAYPPPTAFAAGVRAECIRLGAYQGEADETGA